MKRMKKPFNIFLDSTCENSKLLYSDINNMEFKIDLPERMVYSIPPNWINEFIQILLIIIPLYWLTFSKYILTWFRNQNNWKILMGYLLAPLKIYIFLLQIRLILEKLRCLQKVRIRNVKIWPSYGLFCATRYFLSISNENFKVPQFSEFWTSDSVLLHETYNYI